MSLTASSLAVSEGRNRLWRVAVLLLGLTLPAWMLFGSALTGRTILLATDLLMASRAYMGPEQAKDLPLPRDRVTGDSIFVTEPMRRFAVEEIRHGRLPLWNPHIFAGAPFIAASTFAAFSPLHVLDYLFPGPFVLAWNQWLKMVFAGLGAYLFFRRAMGVGFAAAVVGAWCYPLTGYMALWSFSAVSHVAAWLPWILLAVRQSVREPGGLWWVLLALSTGGAIHSGHSATAGQMLIFAGFYAVWCLVMEDGGWRRNRATSLAAVAALAAGFGLGIMLGLPQLIPTAQYLQASSRVQDRVAGTIESPATGWISLAQVLWPTVLGDTRVPAPYLLISVPPESASAGYAGMLAALVLVPLGVADRRHRRLVIFGLVLGTIGVSQIIGMPILGKVLESPPFNVFRNNRLTFATLWAILMGAVAGLDALTNASWRWRRVFWVPAGAAALLGVGLLVLGWGGVTALKFLNLDVVQPPAWGKSHYASELELESAMFQWMSSIHLQAGVVALLCGLAWVMLRFVQPRKAVWVLGIALPLEMTLATGLYYDQSEPRTYFPPVPALQAIKSAEPGRVTGQACMLPNLLMFSDLDDIRGYDAADPAWVLDTLSLIQHPDSPPSPPYAKTSSLTVVPSPVLDMLHVRYLITLSDPISDNYKTLFQGDGIRVIVNPTAMPRVYVPTSFKTINSRFERLDLMRSNEFDPRRLAIIESETEQFGDHVEGQAQIVEALPCHIKINAQMKTAGVLVLADNWMPGWRVTVNGQEAELLKTNQMLRGVRLDAGQWVVEFHYDPPEFWLGVRLALAAAIGMAGWTAMLALHRGREVDRFGNNSPTVAASKGLVT